MALLLLYLGLSTLFGLADLDLELGIFLLQEQLVIVERLVELHDKVDVSFLLVQSFLHL